MMSFRTDDPGVSPDDARELARERRGAAIIILAACATLTLSAAACLAVAFGWGR